MDSDAAPLADRLLHARIEALLRRAVRGDLARITEQQHTALVVVSHDRSRAQRWLAGGDARLLAAVTAELDPVAAGCLLVIEAGTAHVIGTAVSVSAAGARAFALDVSRRRLGRPRVSFGRQEQPAGVAGEVAHALLATIERAHRMRGPT